MQIALMWSPARGFSINFHVLKKSVYGSGTDYGEVVLPRLQDATEFIVVFRRKERGGRDHVYLRRKCIECDNFFQSYGV